MVLLVISLVTIDGKSQAVVGISGGLYTTDYYCSSNTPHFSGTFESLPGYCLAMTLNGREKPHSHIGFEAAFVRKHLNADVQYGGLGATIYRDVAYDLNYLYLSAFPDWTIGNKLKLSLSAGPQLGVLVYSRQDGNSSVFGGGIDTSWVDTGSASDDIAPVDFRLFLKIGLEFPEYKKFHVFVEGMTGIGLSRAWKHGLESGSRMNSFDKSIRIGLKYRLNSLKLSQH